MWYKDNYRTAMVANHWSGVMLFCVSFPRGATEESKLYEKQCLTSLVA